MKRVVQLFVFAFALIFLAIPAMANTASANLQVSVTVDAACSISTTPVAFSSYAPLGVNASTPDDSTGTVTVRCSTGTVANIGLDCGITCAVEVRHMKSGSDLLSYDLYQNTSRTTKWGNGIVGWLTTPAAPDSNPQVYTVYGRIPAAQFAPPGNYADTVVATVNF